MHSGDQGLERQRQRQRQRSRKMERCDDRQEDAFEDVDGDEHMERNIVMEHYLLECPLNMK